MILLIGDSTDPHLIELCGKVCETQKCTILSTTRADLLSTQFSFFKKSENAYTCILEQNKNIVDIDEVSMAFCLSPLYRLEGKQLSQEARFWYFSWKESLYGFYSLLSLKNVFVNNSVENCLRCQNKILTFPIAQAIGLKIPEPLISNSKKNIANFFTKENQLVLKALHQMQLDLDGESTMILTQKVMARDFADYGEKNESPLFLQSFIDKIYDLRVVVIGSEVLACKIDASKSLLGNVDYRAYDMPNTPHSCIEIPSDLKDKILSLCRMMRLDYVSIDLCVDSSEEYWLLDVNPFGRYLWLEYATGMPITLKMANFLTHKYSAPQ